MLLISDAIRDFEVRYSRAVEACLQLHLPLVICTVYHGNFADPRYQRIVVAGITAYNDVIIRTATRFSLKVIDLRCICISPADYANPIEPSSVGGEKIVRAILRAVVDSPKAVRGAQIFAE